MQNNTRSALQHYSRVGVHSSVESATPHRLIQMLMEGVLSRLASASGHMQRGETAKKGQQLGFAISILEGLRTSLDRAAGGEIAANLDQLYEYMGQRLVEANLANDVAIVEEVITLMRQIKNGWDAIRPVPQAVKRSDPTSGQRAANV